MSLQAVEKGRIQALTSVVEGESTIPIKDATDSEQEALLKFRLGVQIVVEKFGAQLVDSAA